MGSSPRALYPLGREHASRALLLSFVPVELSEEDLKQEWEDDIKTEGGREIIVIGDGVS